MILKRFSALALVAAACVLPGPDLQAGGLLREVYLNIAGGTLDALTNSANFPSRPDLTNVIQEFEAPINFSDNYGQRVRGYVLPPQTGAYTFWISSDDQSALFLGTSEDPVTKTLIASVPNWTASREWDLYPSQTSPPINLEAGKSYYIEALMKEGGGDDNLAVRWQLPDGTLEEPIPETRLVPFGSAITAPSVVSQPQSTNVVEGQAVTFTVGLNPESTLVPIAYQWLRNGVPIAGATSGDYTLARAALSDDGARFRVRASNRLGEALSAEAVLQVTPEHTPPTLVSAEAVGESNLKLTFSEPVDPASATVTGNYTADNGVRILGASLTTDPATILLHVTPLAFGTLYTLTVNNVADRAAAKNLIAPNSKIVFTAIEFAPQDIGKPPAGSIAGVPDGFDVAGGGRGLTGRGDQVQFSHEQRTGDFDVEIRVQSLDLTDVWAAAGLMARETLETNSSFASILATPTITGTFFAYRAGSSNNASLTGSFPVNYPNTWLRLKRAGNIFTGFASYDGEAWNQVGSISNRMASTIFFGLVVSSHSTGQVAHAEFRDLADVTGAAPAAFPLDTEPPGPSSRRTGLVISEIMYHPAAQADGRSLEFIELFNTQPFPEEISGYQLEGGIAYTVPPKVIMPPGSFLVIAQDPGAVRSQYGITNVLGKYEGTLANGSGVVRLLNDLGAVMLEVTYSDQPPWPAAADGSGHSLVLARPSFGEGDPRAWQPSQNRGGSPGKIDPIAREPLRGLVINEMLAAGPDSGQGYIELYNHSKSGMDLSGARLSDDPLNDKFIIPQGTKIPPGGFLAFSHNELGFSPSPDGTTVYLVNSNQTRVLDAVRVGPQAEGVPSGRFPDGAADFRPLQSETPGAANRPLLVDNLVINEIMFHPISENSDDEYVEIYNRGAATIDLAGWRLNGGIAFTFPSNSIISPGAFFVVGRNVARLLAHYFYLNSGNTFGDYQGQLSNSGEKISLQKPVGIPGSRPLFLTVDEVTYSDGGRWGQWADGGGSSLELVDAHSDHRQAYNWATSDETHKGVWTTIEATGVLDNGSTAFGIDNLQVMLLGEGECLIDNVEVIGTTGGNLIPNPTFESDAAGWIARGTHSKSTLEPNEGFNSAHSFHIRASARGDTAANQIQIPLTSSLTPGTIATIRAKVRWLRGNPEILLRLHGNWLEATGRMTIADNLGTPGHPNSAAAANAGPAIFDVKHFPILPATNQAVVVTARVSDPDGIGAMFLRYRVDPSTVLASVPMVDNGTGGDLLAGDGIYSATIPAQPTNNLVAFSIQAFDNSPARLATLFPREAPAREALIHWGESQLPGNLGIYRVWFTKATLDEWASRPPSSNEPLDATFVYGSSRAVYNMGTLYSGSPFHWTGYNSPLGNGANYLLLFPPDEKLLGNTDFVLNLPANINSDPTAQREQDFYWMIHKLGHPYSYRRYVHLFLDGIRRGPIFEDAQQPNSDVVAEWFPNDAGGDLHKIEDWFEFAEDARSFSNVDATLDDFTTSDGQKKLARYRWNWRKRAVTGSANDYAQLFALVDAVNTPDPAEYTAQVESLVDVEEWMRTFAFRHVVGDWDAYGYRRGKNMYAYKPAKGKWALLDWDIAFDFGLGDPVNVDPFAAQHFDGSIDLVSQRMYNHPPFRRIYLRALQDAINGPLLSTNFEPVLDAKYAALTNNLLSVGNPSAIKTWVKSRRDFLLQVLATNAASFEITANGGRDFTVSENNLLTLTGTAPINVKTITVNGIAYPPTWTTVTNWTLRLALNSGVNRLIIDGLDSRGQFVPGASKNLAVTFTGPTDPPDGRLVINEIMYNPAVPGAGFIEIYNTSASQTFDLSNYELKGADFIFPQGTLLPPGSFAVAASDRAVFAATYGTRIPLAGEFQGGLDNGGETLRLIKPANSTGPARTIAQVTYDDDLPWPVAADGQGASLQLIDPSQPNGRVANWAAVAPDASSTPGWRFASVTGTAGSATNLFIYLGSSGDVYIDDVSLVAGPAPTNGVNLVVNGGFETALPPAWIPSTDDSETGLSQTVKHAGRNSLHIVSATGGNSLLPSIAQGISGLQAGSVYTLSFWYLPSPSGGGLTAGLAASDIQKSVSLVDVVAGAAPYTPGAPNSVRASLPPLLEVVINEASLNESGAIADQSGHTDPWIELYNAGSTAVDLSPFYLADNFTNLLQWPFPTNSVINPGEFKIVWLDGEPGETSGQQLHAGFRLHGPEISVALVKKDGAQSYLLDYLHTADLPSSHSFGFFPDGYPNPRFVFEVETPGAPNNNSRRPIEVRINEWMANNVSTIADPSDGKFEDWFELFNAGSTPVDLTGYTATDDLAVPTKWSIPAGTIVPARGYLLIWADNDSLSSSNVLHANFKLSQNGDSIGLFSPDRTLVDSVTFSTQAADVSQGLFPDGSSATFVSMSKATPGLPNQSPAPPEGEALRVTYDQGVVTLIWPSTPGKKYRMQFKNNLNEAAWQDLGADVTAEGTLTILTDTANPEQLQRFYRFMVVD